MASQEGSADDGYPGPVDLLVVGGGMAGLTAAASAATQGARVMLVERGEQVGVSAIYAGFAWTAPSPDVMAEVNPHGDPDLAEMLLGGFERGVEWIRSLGVDCRPAVTVLRYGRGHQFGTTHYLSACEQRIKEHGGNVLTRVRAESLLLEDGTVRGARRRAAGRLAAAGRGPVDPAGHRRLPG